MAADAGYVVLIPLAALAFISAGRHPVAGICAAFSGVSGGFSANLLIGPLDAILSGLSTSAAQIIDPAYVVNAAGNYYFLLASTILITVLGSVVTEWIVEPRLTATSFSGNSKPKSGADPNENAALRWVALYTVLFGVLLAILVIPEQGLLRDPQTGSITRSPFISGIVVIVTLYVAIAGWIYGLVTGNFRGRHGAIDAMEKTMATMAGYLVLMFFAAQFVAWFNWTNLGLITAIRGSELLRALDLGPVALLLFFIMLAASVNLLIGSASAKWAIMAPVFVPMLMLLGISPEATQMAYRIGDSTTNIITPLMPYLALVLAFVQRYDRTAGIGTLVANMVPYSITFFLGWSVLLACWMLLGLPLGPGAGLVYDAGSP